MASEVEEYDYIPRVAQVDDYDYESPFWAPADKRTELLRQFEKLKIRSVAEDTIE